MIKVYIFTYAGDEDEALMCLKSAKKALPEAEVIIVDDKNDPVDKRARESYRAYRARYRQSSFPRNGNLRGPECVRGIISTFAQGAKDDDVIVKIDPDTLLLSGSWVRKMISNGIDYHSAGYSAPQNPLERKAYGCCYAMSGRAAKLAGKALNKAEIPPLAPEDLTIFEAVKNNVDPECIQLDEPWTPRCRKGKWTAWNWFSRTVTPEKYSRFRMVTFGNPRPMDIPKSERAREMKKLLSYCFPEANEELEADNLIFDQLADQSCP